MALSASQMPCFACLSGFGRSMTDMKHNVCFVIINWIECTMESMYDGCWRNFKEKLCGYNCSVLTYKFNMGVSYTLITIHTQV